MPLVQIHFLQGRSAEFHSKIGEIVYKTMMDTINVPRNDNFQIITEHDESSLIYDDEYLKVHRTDGIVIIKITLNEGRTIERKKNFYRHVAERLHRELDIRMENWFISLVKVEKENWSFWNPTAQYAE